ncbi:MAG: hypothetical protein WAU86_09780, partial [Oricola sp.]
MRRLSANRHVPFWPGTEGFSTPIFLETTQSPWSKAGGDKEETPMDFTISPRIEDFRERIAR